MPEAREEVMGGEPGKNFLALARSAARRASATRPTSTGSFDWCEEEIDDLVFDTIDRVTTDRLVLVAAEAASDRQLRGWLIKAMRTTLDLRARRTPAGRVIRAVDAALTEDPGAFTYEHSTGSWRRAGDESPPSWAEGTKRLIEAAWSVETATVAWTKTSTKTGRLARRPDTRAVAAAVLEVAGPLPKTTLAEVIAHRFNAYFIEEYDYLGGLDEPPEVAASPEIAAGDRDPELEDAAQWMLEQFTADERDLLRARARGASIRAIADDRGWKKNQVEKLNARVEAKLLRVASRVEGESDEVAAAMLRILGRQDAPGHSTEQDETDTDGI